MTRRQQRDAREAEVTLQLLCPEPPADAAIRREKEALEIVITAKETLSPEMVKQICLSLIIS